MSTLRSFVLSALAVLALTLPGIGVANAGDSLDGKTVYILTLTASCEVCAKFSNTMAEGIEEEGAKVITQYVDFGAAAEQTQQLNQALSTNPAAIVIWPTDQTSLLPALARAKQTNPGVPIVIAIYPPATDDDSLYTVYFGSDEEWNASVVAESLVEGLKSIGKPVSGSVIHITGALGAYTATARINGFEKRLAEIAPDLTIVETQTANWDLSQAQAVATAMFSKYANDNIVGVYAHSDLMLQGAILAGERAGLTAGEDFIAVGLDCDPIGYANVNDGKEYATILWDPIEFGKLGAEVAIQAAQGKEMPKVRLLELKKITKENTFECEGATVKE